MNKVAKSVRGAIGVQEVLVIVILVILIIVLIDRFFTK